jgi:hypothetical protein
MQSLTDLHSELLERLLREVPARSILSFSGSCRRFHRLVSEARDVWEWLCKRDFNIYHANASRAVPRNQDWKATYRDMCCLDRIEWVEIPKRPEQRAWPMPRWGHTMIRLGNESKVLVFGGEGHDETFQDIQVRCEQNCSPHPPWAGVRGICVPAEFGYVLCLLAGMVCFLCV